MKRTLFLAVACAVALTIAVPGYAIPPAYEGQFGNPEEPALRVVKWPWLGFRKLVTVTHEGLHRGIYKHPPASLCEGSKGAVKGTGILLDHTARGMIYSKLPPKGPLKNKRSYEETAMMFIEKTLAEQERAKNGEPAAPAVTEPQPIKVRDTKAEVRKAQRRYVPGRAAQRDRTPAGRGNLLRLAR